MPLVSTIVRCCVQIVRLVCGRTEGRKDRRTEGQTKYSNPPAHAPRVRVDVGIMSQMVLWVHPIITGYQKTSVFQRKGVNQAYVVLRVVMVR